MRAHAGPRAVGSLTRFAPPLLWMALIALGSSSLLAGDRTALWLPALLGRLAPWASPAMLDVAHFGVRKLGHLAEFGILAVLWRRALAPWSRAVPAALVLASLYAGIDEWRQGLTPDRVPAATDVAIDTLGALLGLAAWEGSGPPGGRDGAGGRLGAGARGGARPPPGPDRPGPRPPGRGPRGHGARARPDRQRPRAPGPLRADSGIIGAASARTAMSVYVARRLAQALIVLLGVSVVVFVILHLTGDPALLLLPPDAIGRGRRALPRGDGLQRSRSRPVRALPPGRAPGELRRTRSVTASPPWASSSSGMPATFELRRGRS